MKWFRKLFPRKLAVDGSHRRVKPERLPQHWLYVLLCWVACIASLWKFAHPNWTLAVLGLLPVLAALVYVPYRVIPSWMRSVLQLLISVALCGWMFFRVHGGVAVDKTLVEVLAGACLLFVMAQRKRDYGYLLTLAMLLLLYGALLPRTIYLWCFFVAFGGMLGILYGGRLRQLAGAPALRNPARLVRRNWHIFGLHLGLAAFLFTVIFPRFPTDMGDTRGLFQVSFMHDKDFMPLPPDLRQWLESEQVRKGEDAQQIVRDAVPDFLGMSGTPVNAGNSEASADGGGDGSASSGRDLVFQVRSQLKLYHVAQLYDQYDGKEWQLTNALKNSRIQTNFGERFQSVSLQYTILKWLGPKLYAPYRPVLFEQRNPPSSFGSIRNSMFNAELRQDTYPQLPFRYMVNSLLSTDRVLAGRVEGDGAKPLRMWEERLEPEHYLQLPEEKISSRLKALVTALTRDCEGEYEKAIKLRDYLRGSFGYEQFAEPVPEGREAVDFFVFDLKKGHCEYFASSLAVMARLAGLPARVATGFSPGDYNTLLNVFEVYEYHGHAWTQIFIPEYGWLTMDATPPGQIISKTTPLGIGQLRDPFGDEWRITPPELTSQTLETLKTMYLKRLQAEKNMSDKTAEMLLEMSRIQENIREKVQDTYQKSLETAPQPEQTGPKTLRAWLSETFSRLRNMMSQLLWWVQENTIAAAAALLMIPVLTGLGRIALVRWRRWRRRRGVTRNFARARNRLAQQDYRGSALASYRSARGVLALAKLPRRRGEELLAYAVRLESEHPEFRSMVEPVFGVFYAVEYGTGPIDRKSAVQTLRRARSLCRLQQEVSDCRGLYANAGRKKYRHAASRAEGYENIGR